MKNKAVLISYPTIKRMVVFKEDG